ncbi:hypothetical protein BS47DRAFT_422059 [Hydnum rufescens UP504]|uniref:Uncharacterized protein n=1 Tax=Hydnum rufescens UP504 TaxID=1448309 RepID=A0A9P6E0D9_9AGAM|nr:hypothetical protein BS47DRAFT_422059 [Hydnum rufescens UP504]
MTPELRRMSPTELGRPSAPFVSSPVAPQACLCVCLVWCGVSLRRCVGENGIFTNLACGVHRSSAIAPSTQLDSFDRNARAQSLLTPPRREYDCAKYLLRAPVKSMMM